MHLLQAGVDMATIALWLGHERLETTHQYVEADLELKEDALRNSSRSVNERSGSRPTPRCWPSWGASDYDKQTARWTPTAAVSPTVTCHNAPLVILISMTSWSY